MDTRRACCRCMGDMCEPHELPDVDVVIACHSEPLDVIEPTATAGKSLLAAELHDLLCMWQPANGLLPSALRHESLLHVMTAVNRGVHVALQQRSQRHATALQPSTLTGLAPSSTSTSAAMMRGEWMCPSELQHMRVRLHCRSLPQPSACVPVIAHGSGDTGRCCQQPVPRLLPSQDGAPACVPVQAHGA
jgi:hypothetical protein